MRLIILLGKHTFRSSFLGAGTRLVRAHIWVLQSLVSRQKTGYGRLLEHMSCQGTGTS